MSWAGVIGSPIAHSLSPVIHTAAWRELGLPEQWQYRRVEVTPQDLGRFVRSLDADCLGLSVTMPHKHAICDFVDVMDPLALAVGAVNTVVPAAGVLTGFNTDVHGIIQALSQSRSAVMGMHEQRGQALILGSGASAASAVNALWTMGVRRIAIAARRFAGPHSVIRAAHRMGIECEQVPYADRDLVTRRMSESDFVVSTLPAGVADELVVPEGVAASQVLLDIVYSPWETPLSRSWRLAGGTVVHGTEMLVHQGAFQVKLMTGREPDVAVMRQALLDAVGRG